MPFDEFEINDLHEAPVSEVLAAVEEQQEQDVLQTQDIHASISSSKDEAEEPHNTNSQIFWWYEFGPKLLGEGGYGYVHAGTRFKECLSVSFFYLLFFHLQNFPYINIKRCNI